MGRHEYNSETDVYEHSIAYLYPGQGIGSDHWKFGLKGGEERTTKLERDGSGGMDEPYVAARNQGVRLGAALVAELGDRWDSAAGWIKCPRTGIFCVVDAQYVPKGKKASRTFPPLCMIRTSKDMGRWTSFDWCTHVVPDGDDRCKMHRSVATRRTQRDEEWKAQRERSRDEDQRRRLLAADLNELWQMACDEMEIDPARRGEATIPWGQTRDANVDAEVLATFLRRIVG